MGKKYEFVNEHKTLVGGETLHRIKALKDFGNVKAGDLGGWIEFEANLSQEGDCWVYDEAMAYDGACVCDKAILRHNTQAYDSALIKDSAVLIDHACAYGKAVVCDKALLEDRALAYNHVIICDKAVLKADAQVYVDGTVVSGEAVLGYNAKVRKTSDYLLVGPMSNMDHDFITYYKTDYGIYVHSIDFDEYNIDDFEDEIKTHKDMGIEPEEYCDKILASISFAKSMLY